MKPLSIADYLERLGSAAKETAPPRPEGSPFRPRSLPNPQSSGPGSKPVLDRIANAGAETPGGDTRRRTPWAPKPALLESRGAGIAAGRASQSNPKISRSNSPKLTRAAARRAAPRDGSRLRTAMRSNSPPYGNRRKRSSGSFVSTSTPNLKARSGPGSKRSRTMSAARSLAFSRRFSRSRSSNGRWRSWPRRLAGSLRAIRRG